MRQAVVGASAVRRWVVACTAAVSVQCVASVAVGAGDRGEVVVAADDTLAGTTSIPTLRIGE